MKSFQNMHVNQFLHSHFDPFAENATQRLIFETRQIYEEMSLVDSVEPFFNILAIDVGLQFTAYSRGRTTIAYALCYCRPYNVVQKLLGPRNISKTLDLPKNNQFVESIQEFLSQNVKNWSEEELRISFSKKRINSKNWIANTEPRHLLESFT